MEKRTIMLVCSAGMSTSMLVSKMKKVAEEKGIEADIFATSSTEAEKKLENEKINVVLFGPQVRFLMAQFEDILKEKNIPGDVINMADYGIMNGEKVLAQAIGLIG
ncbi:PTS sugar transporter subunit IIB [Clostridium diolis]|uniref:PTS sugar transporter subunit IIB n=1 Tax=Clostridium diolis TaxID=223919 RepID=UPI000B3F80EA|nr:PTS sugar transporter subunit IIB [Clostridium diolis]OVE65023.1 PTS sugar transporter subunit IIB [Clostridium diolis]